MTFIVNVLLKLLAFKIVTPGSASIRTVYKYSHSGFILITGIIFYPRTLFFGAYLYFEEAIAFLEKFLCFLQLSDRAYVSRALCIGLFVH